MKNARLDRPVVSRARLLLTAAGLLFVLLPAVVFARTDFGPVAVDDPSYVTAQDTALVVAAPGVLANDYWSGNLQQGNIEAQLSQITDDFPSLIATDATTPGHGTVSLEESGTFTYTPAPGFFGVDTFQYKAAAWGGEMRSEFATVTITVTEKPKPKPEPEPAPAPVVIPYHPHAVVGTPHSPYMVRRGRSFEVYGFVTGKHRNGTTPVTLYAYHPEGRKWVLRTTALMTAYNFPRTSKYAGYISLPDSGAWLLVARHPRSGPAFDRSGPRYMFVR
jgi:hypothetical protein